MVVQTFSWLFLHHYCIYFIRARTSVTQSKREALKYQMYNIKRDGTNMYINRGEFWLHHSSPSFPFISLEEHTSSYTKRLESPPCCCAKAWTASHPSKDRKLSCENDTRVLRRCMINQTNCRPLASAGGLFRLRSLPRELKQETDTILRNFASGISREAKQTLLCSTKHCCKK